MRIFYKKAVPAILSLSLAAAVAVSGTGCAAGSGSEDGEEEVITVYVTNVDPYAGLEEEDGLSSTASSAEGADAASGFGTGAFPAASAAESAEAAEAGTEDSFPAATDMTADADRDSLTSEISAAADPEDSGSETASTGMTAGEDSSSVGSGLAAPVPAGSVSTFTGAGTDRDAEDSGDDSSNDDGEKPFALDGGTDVYSEPEEDEEDRSEDDTPLRESVLHEALTECTGWGQSAGSSLRAANAAAQLLRWANQADAGSADADMLEKAVRGELDGFSSEEKDNIRDNWSSISYDASMILDDFDEISYLLEDAGCSETAREAAQDQNALTNWKAAEKALKAALK